jgi:hypothetical protein
VRTPPCRLGSEQRPRHWGSQHKVVPSDSGLRIRSGDADIARMKLACPEIRHAKLTALRGSIRLDETYWYSSQVYPL